MVVDTVQIYIAITNYDDFRLEEGRETEASHERAMRLLHLYYSAADRAIVGNPQRSAWISIAAAFTPLCWSAESRVSAATL